MTRPLIDPAAVEAIKARQAGVPTFELTPARAVRLTDKQRVDAIFLAAHTLGKIFGEVAEDDGTDLGTWIFTAAQTSRFTLDLFLYAAQLFASPHPDPRKALRDKTRETLTIIGTVLRDYLQEQGEAMEAGLRAQAEEKANAALDEARLQLDAASAQLTRERETHAREVAQLREQLERDRITPHSDAPSERLHVTPTEEPPMPTPGPQTPLETASLCQFLNEDDPKVYTWSGTAIRAEGCTIDFFDASILVAWRFRYPTPASMREQLRALIRPILQRSAA